MAVIECPAFIIKMEEINLTWHKLLSKFCRLPGEKCHIKISKTIS